MSRSENIRWSHKSLSELRVFWGTKIEPTLERAGHDLDERPTYQDLVDAGYSGIAYTLREHHDMTLTEFLADVGYEGPGSDGSYPWGIADETTIDELQLYLRSNQRRKERSEATIDSKRSRLARYVRTYADLFDSAAVVERVRGEEVPRRDERQRVYAVLDAFDDELTSPESKLKHLSDVRLFYQWLREDRDASYNPAANAPHRSAWESAVPDPDERDPPSVEARDVRALIDACWSLEERLLIIATCGWGLRRAEVAGLQYRNFELDDGDPRIVFEERKNGPGRVTVHYGLEDLNQRIIALDDRDRWNGYLFPSANAERGHIVPDTVTRRFGRIADRAGVTVRGETPTPQYGRRFWYRTYLDAVEILAERVEAIAEEQGSDDPSVVVENYLGEEEARRRRRQLMREQLADAFEV